MSFHPSNIRDATTSLFQLIFFATCCQIIKWETSFDLARSWVRSACSTSINQRTKAIDQAVSPGRCGMWGKLAASCNLAPNNDQTRQLLKAKHPSCPTPVTPVAHTAPVSLEPDFNIMRSSSKDTAAGPSELRVQHLLDVVSTPLPTPISSSLR